VLETRGRVEVLRTHRAKVIYWNSGTNIKDRCSGGLWAMRQVVTGDIANYIKHEPV
jgi:hypothetical protein